MRNKSPGPDATPPLNPEAVAEAARILRRGGLVAFPTETVYGLGGDATCDRAVARIFEVKGRPRFNPLIVHASSLEAALELGAFGEAALKLARSFWPGPLSIVVPRIEACTVSRLASAGLETIALRVPAHAWAQALLAECAIPLAAPSANRSGAVSPTRVEHVRGSLGEQVDFMLDGGTCPVGVESTIIDCAVPEPAILRHGGMTREDIEAVLGQAIAFRTAGAVPAAPGQLDSHYAPRTRLRLNAESARPGEALLAFGPVRLKHDGAMLNLSESGDMVEAAANLFAHLHTLDAAGAEAIAVMPVPRERLGEAINDRLERAAAPRDA